MIIKNKDNVTFVNYLNNLPFKVAFEYWISNWNISLMIIKNKIRSREYNSENECPRALS